MNNINSNSNEFMKHMNVFMNNMSTNDKGAFAFSSTSNPILDLFTYQNKQVPTELNKFVDLIKMMEDCLENNFPLALKLLKYKRLIKKGEGMHMLSFIMMLLIRFNDPSLYEEILKWYAQCNKDILRLSKMVRQYGLDNEIEINCFSDFITKAIIMAVVFDDTRNLLAFKYLPSNGNHFEKERKQIRMEVNRRLMAMYPDVEVFNNLQGDKQVINILVETYNEHSVYITNKSLRQLKSYFDSKQYLATPLLRGFHHTGDKFGFGNPEEEHAMIGKYLTKLSTQALERVKKTIKNYEKIPANNPREKYLMEGYKKYQEYVTSNTKLIKTNGLSLVEQLWEVFCDPTKFNNTLGAQVEKLAEELHDYIHDSFNNNYSCDDFARELLPIIDYSGSMQGKPIETAYYQVLLLWQAFDLKQVIKFSTEGHLIELPDNLNVEEKIKYLYSRIEGSTCLDKAFELVREDYEKTLERRFVLILTDGDCDFCFKNDTFSSNPFHHYLDKLPYHQFCVFNLKQDKLAFPYLAQDPRVSYLSGNNPKVLIGVTRAIVNAVMNETHITPNDVLYYSLDLDELDISRFDIDNFKYNKLNSVEIEKLFKVVNMNVPKKYDVLGNINDDSSDWANDPNDNWLIAPKTNQVQQEKSDNYTDDEHSSSESIPELIDEGCDEY